MTATRPAAPHELVPGAVIRFPAIPGLYARPFGLEITWREPTSKATGAICLGGKVLAQDGTTTRRRPPHRRVVITPGLTPPVTVIRRAAPREFFARIAILSCPSPDPELPPLLTTRWGIVDADGRPLRGEGIGPARIGDYVQAGDWEGRPTPWLAKEYAEQDEAERSLRRDPIDQCIDRVRQERGILHLSDRLTYDLSVWPHSAAQELRPAGDGNLAWRGTCVCKRCHQQLKRLGRSPWTATLDDDEECHGGVWVP